MSQFPNNFNPQQGFYGQARPGMNTGSPNPNASTPMMGVRPTLPNYNSPTASPTPNRPTTINSAMQQLNSMTADQLRIVINKQQQMGQGNSQIVQLAVRILQQRLTAAGLNVRPGAFQAQAPVQNVQPAQQAQPQPQGQTISPAMYQQFMQAASRSQSITPHQLQQPPGGQIRPQAVQPQQTMLSRPPALNPALNPALLSAASAAQPTAPPTPPPSNTVRPPVPITQAFVPAPGSVRQSASPVKSDVKLAVDENKAKEEAKEKEEKERKEKEKKEKKEKKKKEKEEKKAEEEAKDKEAEKKEKKKRPAKKKEKGKADEASAADKGAGDKDDTEDKAKVNQDGVKNEDEKEKNGDKPDAADGEKPAQAKKPKPSRTEEEKAKRAEARRKKAAADREKKEAAAAASAAVFFTSSETANNDGDKDAERRDHRESSVAKDKDATKNADSRGSELKAAPAPVAPAEVKSRRHEGMRGSMRNEIARLMYAAGDVAEPDLDTVDYMEDMVTEFLADLCRPVDPIRLNPTSKPQPVPLGFDVIRHRIATTPHMEKYVERYDHMVYMSDVLKAHRRIANPNLNDLVETVGNDYLGLDDSQPGTKRAADGEDGQRKRAKTGKPINKVAGEKRKPGPQKGWKLNRDPATPSSNVNPGSGLGSTPNQLKRSQGQDGIASKRKYAKKPAPLGVGVKREA